MSPSTPTTRKTLVRTWGSRLQFPLKLLLSHGGHLHTSNPSHKCTLLDLFKRGLISQEELEAGLIDTASSPPAGKTSKPGAATAEYRSLSGHETKLSQIRVLRADDILAGKFRLNRPIGRGAMGVVWLADDLPGKRQVCVKLLPPVLQHDLTKLGRVREMFQKVHALQHQHLCPVYLLGSDPLCGEFLVMKYIDGQTLSEYRRSYVEQHGEFPLTEVVRVLAPVADSGQWHLDWPIPGLAQLIGSPGIVGRPVGGGVTIAG